LQRPRKDEHKAFRKKQGNSAQIHNGVDGITAEGNQRAFERNKQIHAKDPGDRMVSGVPAAGQLLPQFCTES
jgi:hypothetical protein